MNCHRCQQTVPPQAVVCPHCKAPLKAYGHPGIPLYRAEGEEYLCDRCLYHADDSCTYPQRPYAKSCILFRDVNTPLPENQEPSFNYSGFKGIRIWCDRHRRLLLVLAILAIAILLALS